MYGASQAVAWLDNSNYRSACIRRNRKPMERNIRALFPPPEWLRTLTFETNLSTVAYGATLGCASSVAESQEGTSPKKKPSRTTKLFGAEDDDDGGGDDNDAKEAEGESDRTDVAPTPVNTDADEAISKSSVGSVPSSPFQLII
nr:unnamed protein product [Spirometra erinaceieuropaei]